jgi:hypothetical protein
MHTLQTTKTLARLVLAWFVLMLGIAIASPIVAPKTMEMVCSDGGPMKLIVVDQSGDVTAAGQHTLDCAMCLPASLTAPVAGQIAPQLQPLAYALNPVEKARIAALVGAPLPPRGPPSGV